MTNRSRKYSIYRTAIDQTVSCVRSRLISIEAHVWNRFELIEEEFFVYTAFCFTRDDVNFERRIVSGPITLYIFENPDQSFTPIVRTKNMFGHFMIPEIAPSRFNQIWDAYRLSLIESYRGYGLSKYLKEDETEQADPPPGYKRSDCGKGHLIPAITLAGSPCPVCLRLEKEEAENKQVRYNHAMKASQLPTVALIQDAASIPPIDPWSLENDRH